MQLKRKIFFITLLIASCMAGLQAQIPFFKTFTVNKERNTVRVQRMIKDSKGLIWLGTSEGLYQFNGSEFLKITTEFVRDSSVTALYEDSHKRLWVGFRSGKIATVENNSVKLFLPEGRLPKSAIHAFMEDRNFHLWCATNGEGVFYYSGNVFHNINSDDGLTDDYTYTLALDGNGAMWIGTDQGVSICRLNGDKKEITKLTSTEGLPDNIVRVLLPDANGDLWIGMQDKGVCKYYLHEKSFAVPAPLQHWDHGQVNCLLETENDLWIGTESNGIIDVESNSDQPLRHLVNGDHVRLSKINDLLEDGEFNVWIANNNQLIRSSGEQISFITNLESLKDSDEEVKKTNSFRFIHTILYDSFGNLWFTPDQGLARISVKEKSGRTLTRFTITPPKELIDITALYEDPYGFLWIGTMGRGMYRMNIHTGKFIKVPGDTLLTKASILSIAGKDDELWFAGLEGVKKCKIENGGSEQVHLRYADITDVGSFGKNYVYSIFIDSRNRVWFGTDDKGIVMYDHGKLVTYTTKDGLRSNIIYSITEDPSGNIWFSTFKAGLYRFNGASFKNYSTPDGLSDLTIYSITSDSFGNIVILDKHGIDVLDHTTGLFSYYDSSVGIEDVNADLNSITKDRHGNIWIGSESGIIRYHPCMQKKLRQPVTVISNMAVFLESVDYAHVNKFLYDQNNITFTFNGIWYSDPDRVQYQYVLEGYNPNWINSHDRVVTYPKLAPGKYTFRVRSSLNQNFANASEARYVFAITPPYWQRWWFKVILALAGVLLLRVYIINRERRIKHLEHLQKERIEFQFETLKSQVNPHFLFNSFNTLISIIEDSPKRAVEYVERMSQFFRSIVTYREKDVITLAEELDLLDNYYFLQKKRYGENLRLEINVPDDITNSRYIPPLTLQLLMENAVKHNAVSRETPLTVEIFIGKHGKLTVHNNTNKKIRRETATGMGLQNIISRYKLLSDRTVEIKSDEHFFEVSIPLLKEE